MLATFFWGNDRESVLLALKILSNVASDIKLLLPLKAINNATKFGVTPWHQVQINALMPFITRAGLAVPSNEMKSHEIDETIMIQLVNHIDLTHHNLPCSQDAFLRSSRHCDHIVMEKDLHNGSTLWRKYLSIKKYVNNQITPLYVKNLGPDGQPPSGMTLEDILLRTRKQLHDIE